jgi:cytochrome c biogenesis protein CcmG/thiol:disulfide interchange protein DsbE
MALRIIPLLLFLALAGFFGFRLMQIDENPNSGKNIPSPLIGKPAPEFELPDLQDPTKTFARKDLLGKVTLVVVWASWCPSCRDEAPLLNHLQQQGIVRVVGLNYKDDPDDAKRWLEVFGDPYELNGIDRDGRVGLDWGVYGAPESILVDKKGHIRDKFIAAISRKAYTERLLPMIKTLEAEQG